MQANFARCAKKLNGGALISETARVRAFFNEPAGLGGRCIEASGAVIWVNLDNNIVRVVRKQLLLNS
jgi:hypothetical protein